MRQRLLIAFVALSVRAAGAGPEWRLARSEHFEVYAQSGAERAQAILGWFERLREFFDRQGGWKASGTQPVRVIVFASEQEYRPYRVRDTADAYYVGATGQDYIVMGADDPAKFDLAAHEYAHLVLHASGIRYPPWLAEGISDLVSTLHIGERSVELGGPLAGRVQTLNRREWIPLDRVMSMPEDAPERQLRRTAELFYAESWALTDMLALSPDYAPGFDGFIARVGASVPGPEALTSDLHRWVGQARWPTIELPPLKPGASAMQVAELSGLESRLMLAHLMLAAGDYVSAEARFRAIASDAPASPEVSAALGEIALHKGDAAGARRAWKQAIDQGIADARLCYNYAILADQAGLSPDDIRPALERAIHLQPDFDEAHYQLALLEKQTGHYETALREFRAMREVSPGHAFVYWLAMADAYNELGRREEAVGAAQRAGEHAANAKERARAGQQIRLAQTDLGVQFSRDASGNSQLVTTRVPHQQTDWNPFVEPGDDIRRVSATLIEIGCGEPTTIRVEVSGKFIRLTIPDLQHVQMRHAPADFVCGEQPPTPVVVEYARRAQGAVEGVVRGMTF
jgi:tetratricopeptide (TPR) repeat protein